MSFRMLATLAALGWSFGTAAAGGERAAASDTAFAPPVAIPPALAGAAAPAPPSPPEPRVRAWQIGLLRADRLQHGSFAFTSGIMMGLASEQPAVAAGGSLALGLAKELWDARQSRFDLVDLVAAMLGAAAATGVTVTVTR